MIPLLLAQFRRSEYGIWVLYGFFASKVVLLLTSWFLAIAPGLSWRGRTCQPDALNVGCQFGIAVGDYVGQSTLFTICAFGAIWRACDYFYERRFWLALVLAVLATLFLANMAFIASSRTEFGVVALLLLLFGWRRVGWKGVLAGIVTTVVLAAVIWESSSYVRHRAARSVDEIHRYLAENEVSSTGIHLEMLKKSISIIHAAPIIGYGTGSIDEAFQSVAIGDTGLAGMTTVNPHNQLFAVAIQLGLIGAVVLVAMWTAHYILFRSNNWIAWAGTVVVVDNISSSLFNSHLFDFMHGSLYVFGVGVVGGMVRREVDNVSREVEARAQAKS